MPIAFQASTLQMEWCLECHRHPERFVRQKDKVFDMDWPPENKTQDQLSDGARWKAEYHIQDAKVLTSCSTCHR